VCVCVCVCALVNAITSVSLSLLLMYLVFRLRLSGANVKACIGVVCSVEHVQARLLIEKLASFRDSFAKSELSGAMSCRSQSATKDRIPTLSEVGSMYCTTQS